MAAPVLFGGLLQLGDPQIVLVDYVLQFLKLKASWLSYGCLKVLLI